DLGHAGVIVCEQRVELIAECGHAALQNKLRLVASIECGLFCSLRTVNFASGRVDRHDLRIQRGGSYADGGNFMRRVAAEVFAQIDQDRVGIAWDLEGSAAE